MIPQSDTRCFAGPAWTILIARCVLPCLLALAGCPSAHPELGQIAGRVTLQGEPVATGCVVFENLALGVSQVANLSADGSYQMVTPNGPGILPGSYRVAIRPDPMGTGETPLAADPAAALPAEPTSIPQEYQHAATSPLRCEVLPGPNPPADYDLPISKHKTVR